MASGFDSYAWRAEMRLGMSAPHLVTLDTAGLPEPLRAPADAMQEARNPDVAKAAAQEFLLKSSEWVDSA